MTAADAASHAARAALPPRFIFLARLPCLREYRHAPRISRFIEIMIDNSLQIDSFSWYAVAEDGAASYRGRRASPLPVFYAELPPLFAFFALVRAERH